MAAILQRSVAIHCKNKTMLFKTNIEQTYNKDYHFLRPDVPAEPDGGEVTPAQLPEDLVPVVEGVTDLDWVVAACKHIFQKYLNLIFLKKYFYIS